MTRFLDVQKFGCAACPALLLPALCSASGEKANLNRPMVDNHLTLHCTLAALACAAAARSAAPGKKVTSPADPGSSSGPLMSKMQ
jgi:hypothetical protein